MKLEELLQGYDYRASGDFNGCEITGITHDSREVRPGNVYVCLEGLRTDGHLFAGEAAEKGAVAVVARKPLILPVPVILVRDTRNALSYLSDSFFGRPSREIHIVGVTGTNGKTTTTHFLESIYEAAGRRCAVIGTVGFKTEKGYLPSSLTTPEAFELHRFLRELAERKTGSAVMEVSSHALAWQRVEHVRFDTAVFTNLSHEHLDFHKTIEAYFLAKAHLFELLSNETDRPRAVINADDPYGKRLLKMVNARPLSFGLENGADVRGKILASSSSTKLVISYKGQELKVTVSLPGEFNAYNALAAAAVALAEGITPAAVKRGIESLKNVPGRFETVDFRQEFHIFIDFAHTPDGLEKVLQTLKEFPHRRIITVFGCPGERDRAKRPVMGRIAELYSDLVILTADNPAGENAEAIIREIATGMQSRPVILPDRNEAIKYALSQAQKGDIVLLAGKGHENYQLVGNKRVPYSDREVVEKYFLS
ncbi:MAG TPA: UDP-N-acetylmuramoyl-L-alanyl-D-glutamate--2,6-diaminopimelate ligase [Firmicutes bacterium]|nr:UDP-N-acetylmuramoyl-L-alanyl-D-glutamate--2,6-diaminopimelate ligase [Bacillota bacterium]